MAKHNDTHITQPELLGSLVIQHTDINGQKNELTIPIGKCVSVVRNEGKAREVFEGTQTSLVPARAQYRNGENGEVFDEKTPYKVLGNSVIDPANITNIFFRTNKPDQALALVDADKLFGVEANNE